MVRRPITTTPQPIPDPVALTTQPGSNSVSRGIQAQEPDLQSKHGVPRGAENMSNTNKWREPNLSTYQEPKNELSYSQETVEGEPSGQIHNPPAVPASLRPGHADITPRSSSESQRSEALAVDSRSSPVPSNSQSNNPYLRSKNIDPASPQNFPLGEESSAKAWANSYSATPIHNFSPKTQGWSS